MRVKASLEFGGAVEGEVSGSCFKLEVKRGKKTTFHLIDCGIMQSENDYSKFLNRNRVSMVDPKRVSTIILTHPHLDHFGNTGRYGKDGFNGRIFCVKAGFDLAEPMLMDAAKLSKAEAVKFVKRIKDEKQDAAMKKKKLIRRLKKGPREKFSKEERKQERLRKVLAKIERNGKKIKELLLFSEEDVRKVLKLFKNGGYDYLEWIKLDKGIDLKFYPSGHILGGAICVIRIKSKMDDKDPTYVAFTGDLGREDNPILNAFQMIKEPIHKLIIESTYGGVNHSEREKAEADLLAIAEEICRTGGVMIMPTYAVQKCQEILYFFASHMLNKTLPTMPIHVDSPLAEKITREYIEHWNDSDIFRKDGKIDNPIKVAIKAGIIKFVGERLESEALAMRPGPRIVLAGSGACVGGRVRLHLRKGLHDPKNKVVFTSYIFKGTLGRRLKDGYKTVKIDNSTCPVNAEVRCFDEFSAHADNNTLIRFIEGAFKISPNLEEVFLVHGEKERILKLKEGIINSIGLRVVIPQKGKTYEVC